MMTLLTAPASRHGTVTASMSPFDEPEIAGFERADVDDHVDLTRAVEDCPPRLVVLHVGRGGAERNPTTDVTFTVSLAARARRAPPRWGSHTPWRNRIRRLAQSVSMSRRVAIRPEQRVVDHRGDASAAPPAACQPKPAWRPRRPRLAGRSGQHSYRTEWHAQRSGTGRAPAAGAPRQ